MDIAAEVRPLAWAEPAVDGDKEAHRRVEELVVALDLFELPDGVVTAGAESPVQLRTETDVSVEIRLLQLGRQGWIFGFKCLPVPTLDCLGGLPLDLFERLPGQRVDVPRLEIAVRCRACCALNQFTDDIQIDRLAEEPTAGDA